jgi:hypothetical protein
VGRREPAKPPGRGSSLVGSAQGRGARRLPAPAADRDVSAAEGRYATPAVSCILGAEREMAGLQNRMPIS